MSCRSGETWTGAAFVTGNHPSTYLRPWSMFSTIFSIWGREETEASPIFGAYRVDAGVLAKQVLSWLTQEHLDVKAGVPAIMPSWVSGNRSSETARPESPILPAPSAASQTSPGFKSLWLAGRVNPKRIR